MVSFSKKFFFQKCLTGVALILLGCAKTLFPTSRGWLFYFFLAVYAAAMLGSLIIKAEPQDERAIENVRKAKSHLYDLFLILIFVNAIFAYWDGKTLELTGELVLILFGVLQFAEYLHFLRFEKSQTDE